MSDTTSRGGDDALGGGFDQTNDMVGGLEGESDGTAEGESRPDDGEGDGTLAGGGVLDDLRDGLGDPYVGDTERADAAGEGTRSTGD
jgi:hypothetical protein